MKSRAHLFTFLALLAVVIPLNIRLLAPYMLSLFMGAILALISAPVYERLLKHWPPRRSALVVTLAGLLLIIAPMIFFLSKGAQQAAMAGQEIAQSKQLSFKSLTGKLERWKPTAQIMGSGPQLEQQLRNGIRQTASAASAAAMKVLSVLPMVILQVTLACLAWFFMLKDGERFVDWLVSKLPLDDDVREQLVDSLKTTAISTVWATLAAAAAQATVMTAGYLLLGVPSATLAWGSTFILSWFPMVGSLPVSLAGVGWLYAQGEYVKMSMMIGVGVLVTLVDNVVRPWVLKGRQDLHPFVGLLAVVAGIDMFGLLGAFAGPVLVSIGIALLNLWPTVAGRYGVSVPEDPSRRYGRRRGLLRSLLRLGRREPGERPRERAKPVS